MSIAFGLISYILIIAKVILILILYNALTDYLIIFAEVIDLSR